MTYAKYKINVDMWKNAMKGYMSEKNMGMTLLQSLPTEDNKGGIKEQVHRIASRLSIRAVDLKEQTVEAIKALTDTNRVLIKANKPKKTKEEENVNIAEDTLGEGADKSYAEWKKAQN